MSDTLSGSRHSNGDRVSLSTLEEGTTLQVSSKGKADPLRGRMDELKSIRIDLNLDFMQHQWLTDKMKEWRSGWSFYGQL